MKTYKFSWLPDKNSIKLPDNFLNQFKKSAQEIIPIIIIDDNANQKGIIYNKSKNSLLLKELTDWINDFRPKKNEKILFKKIDKATYKISILNRPSKSYEGLFIGKRKDEFNELTSNRNFTLPLEDLMTHVFICGATGSGKTVLGKAIIEEAAKKGIPAIVVDLKGDLSSIGLIFSKYNHENLINWITAPKNKRNKKCKEKVKLMNDGLEEFGFSDRKLNEYKSKISVAVFTPKVNKAIQLAISSPLAAPKDIDSFINSNRGEVLEMVGSLSESFIKNLFAERRIGRLDKYKTFLQELVRFCWEKNVNLEGKKGLRTIQRLINEPPIDKIGGMPLDEFFNQKMRNEFSSRIAMCLSGVEQLWFEGVPLDIRTILKRPGSQKKKTPVSIINIADLSFSEQMYVISQLSYCLYNWARPLGSSGSSPRVIFFVDEIGGGGGKQAFYPSYPYDPPSKPPLNILLRKGRTFGISCIFATQNPGDIDYKGLSNCSTWAVGTLRTDRDRKKVMEGISTADFYIDNIKRKLERVKFKDFLLKTKDGKVNFIKERWLVSLHKTLSDEELKRINKKKIKEFFQELYVK